MSDADGRPGADPRAGSARPFEELRTALAGQRDISRELLPRGDDPGTGEAPLRLDPGRWRRTGIPEVVLAQGKSPATVLAALAGLARANGRAIASRCDREHLEAVSTRMPGEFRVQVYAEAQAVLAICAGHDRAGLVPTGGRVAVIAAGAADARAAAEAALIAAEMGCQVRRIDDVGVAGLHRLIEPLETLLVDGVDALVVAAGMDGALPSVVAGLVDVPVIGLPTAVGYGLGGRGEAALLAMLQSCAAGLVVVNIDNGLGAGAAAARIANRAAEARRGVVLDDRAWLADDHRSMPANSEETTSAGERERSTT